MSRLTLGCAVTAGLIAAGCATMAGAPATVEEARPPTTRVYTSEQALGLYVEKCGMCHRAGGMGTGLLARRVPADMAALEEREGLTEEFVTAVVRSGVLNMPALSRAEVSDPQLAAIAAYLAAGPYEME